LALGNEAESERDPHPGKEKESDDDSYVDDHVMLMLMQARNKPFIGEWWNSLSKAEHGH
jgi:hypothetical protein